MRFWPLLALLCLAQPAAAQSDADALQTIELRGTVGPYAVGVSIIERNKIDILAAHYFYAAHCINIPLQTSTAGGTLSFAEPGGAVMHLHFTNNHEAPAGAKVSYWDSVSGGIVTAGTALNFWNATGMAGEWTDGRKTLPVQLDFNFILPGIQSGRWYENVTDEPDAVFEARVQRFLTGALTGNKLETASTITFPLRVSDKQIKTRTAFYAQWNEIFTPQYLAQLRNAVPHEMFVHEGMAMLGNSDVWFGPNGQTVLQP